MRQFISVALCNPIYGNFLAEPQEIKIPWMEEPCRLQSMRSLRSDTTERLHFHFSLLCIGEGNGNPLQCSCLENPRDGGAWWAVVYGVAQSRTRLKRLSSSSRKLTQVLWMTKKRMKGRKQEVNICVLISHSGLLPEGCREIR